MSDAASTMPTTGRWGWYRDHNGDEHRRVSKLLEYLETKPGTFNLRKWDLRRVAEGLAIRDDLVLAIKAMGRPDPATGWTREQKDKIDSIARDAQVAAKQRDGARVGTAVHDLTERVDRGEPIDEITRGLPAEPATALRAYEHLLRANGWRVTEIERTVQCEELGDVTGSLDREYEIPGLSALLGPGTCQHGHDHTDDEHELPTIGDVKTEAQPWLNGIHIAPQMAIYSRARKMWQATGGTRTIEINGRQVTVPNGRYVPAPCVRQDVAVIVHVHDGRAHPYFVRLDAGWRSAQRAYAQMLDESEAKRPMGAAGAWFAPMPNIVEPKPAELLVAHSVANRIGHLDAAPTGGSALPELTMPAAPQHAVGDTVTVGGVAFTKHAEMPSVDGMLLGSQRIDPVEGEQIAVRDPATGLVSWRPTAGLCDNCAPLLVGASATRVDGTTGETPCNVCANPTPEAMPAAEATTAEANADNLRKSLIAAIWQAATVQRLSELWQLAQQNGVAWSGPVEMAGAARRRQIECVQRALHVGSGKCACGWMPPVPA